MVFTQFLAVIILFRYAVEPSQSIARPFLVIYTVFVFSFLFLFRFHALGSVR